MRPADAPRCATPLIYSGELQLRPEVEAALAELEGQPYTAIPSWQGDGRWELWTVQGDGQTTPCIISGPAVTFASREEALVAGEQWLQAQA